MLQISILDKVLRLCLDILSFFCLGGSIMSTKAVQKQQILFTTGNIPKSILAFCGPFLLGILVQNLYGAVDLFVVGQYATTADVSAVTIGSQLMAIVTQLIIGFATGITILIGQYFGAKDKKGLTRTVGASVTLFGISAFILMATYIILHKQFILAVQTPAEAVRAAEQYLLACSFGIVFIVGYNVVSNILTGLGDSKTSFIIILIACIINIVLDVILVKYFYLGALGAAIATTAAQAGSFFFSLIYLKRKGLGFPFSRSDIRFDKMQSIRIIKIGGPVAIQNVMVSFSFLFITAIINQIGLVASAAVGIVEKLITFLFVPATAMGTSVGTASSQNLGAGQPERARKCMWWGIMLAFSAAVLITLYCQIGGATLTGLLSKDREVVLLAASYLKSYILDILMVSLIFPMNGFFNSCGKSWFSLVHSLVTTFAVRIPMAYFLSRTAESSLFLIGFAAPASTLVSVIMCIIFLKWGDSRR